ncbi:hypothetical protein HC744_00030 [Arthrobacter sp. S1_S22]|nr:hypothetical protein [Arthrobacter sp. S1_S22]
MSKVHVLLSSVLGALTSIAPTVSALLIFSAREFGVFAFLYAVFALGWSICLSVVCDAFLRTVKCRDQWREYSSALVGLSMLITLVAVVVSLFVYPDITSALLAAGAIGLGIYRLGARFFRSLELSAATVLWTDVCNLAVFLTVLFSAIAIGTNNFTSHAIAWFVAGLASLGMSRPVMLNPWRALLSWCRRRWETIQALLSDSIVMDCGAILGPLLLLPGLGTHGFGIYRGMSSVASPVQLVLDPVRPNLAQMSSARRTGLKLLLGVLGVGLVMSVACFTILLSLSYFDLVQGTLAELSAFAVPCSVFVFTNFLGHFYYLLSRAHSSARKIRTGRAVQTALAISCPLVGVALFGLSGAVWGFVGATMISSVTWTSLMLTSLGQRPT